MRPLLLIALLSVALVGCHSTRHATNNQVSHRSHSSHKASKVVDHARSFVGTRYRYGGTSSRGMDCSGLVYVSFKKEAIPLPRITRDMARAGNSVPLRAIRRGDLVFFGTGKNQKVINHVGLVVEVRDREIAFVHSTTSRGVIISTMDEPYWRDSFVEVRRVM